MYIYRKLFHYTPMINSKNKLETLVWQLMNGQPKISSERWWKKRKYIKLAANVIQTLPLQSPRDDFSFGVTRSFRSLSTSHRSAR